jgi:hypothetical protein
MGIDYRDYDPRERMELEPQEDEEVLELEKVKSDLKTQTERLNYKIYQLKKLAEFHQLESWGMSLSHEQQKEKLEILNMYL